MSLFFRIGNAGNLVNESVSCIDIDQIRVHLVAEYFDNLFRFTLTQETVVDMNTDEILADCLDQKSSDNRTVNTAGKRQQHFSVFNLFTDLP